MNCYRPDVDEGEQRNVCELVEREQEREDVVGDTLREAIERVESMAGEWRGDNPLVMRLVQVLVHCLVV